MAKSPRKCRDCRKRFFAFNSKHIYCSSTCASRVRQRKYIAKLKKAATKGRS